MKTTALAALAILVCACNPMALSGEAGIDGRDGVDGAPGQDGATGNFVGVYLKNIDGSCVETSIPAPNVGPSFALKKLTVLDTSTIVGAVPTLVP